MWPCWQRTMMSSIFLMSHDLSQPIRTGSEADAPTKEGPHSVGVWTLKIIVWKFVGGYFFIRFVFTWIFLLGSNKITSRISQEEQQKVESVWLQWTPKFNPWTHTEPNRLYLYLLSQNKSDVAEVILILMTKLKIWNIIPVHFDRGFCK